MVKSQQSCERKWICKANRRQRLIAGAIFTAIACLFAVLWLGATDRIDLGVVLLPCGFQQKYELPCPTCGFTRSAQAFVRGELAEAFYVQPAAALICCGVAVGGFFALLTAGLGIYWHFFVQFWHNVKKGYIILALIIVIVGGWAVTLARALATSN